MRPEPTGHYHGDANKRHQERVPYSGPRRRLVIEGGEYEIFLERSTAGEMDIHRFLGEAESYVFSVPSLKSIALPGRLALDNDGEECSFDGFAMA
jgi:hypothetical protein